MASLLAELQESGSRKSDGTANAAGKVWAYLPNTQTPVNLYTDEDLTAVATQPITLDNGGRVPRSNYPDGLWVTQKIRLLVQDETGLTVSDTTFIPADAGNTAVENEGFTSSTLDGVLTSAHTSFGGQDFKYLIAAGQTERQVGTTITEISVSVKAFGAKGDGVEIDTTHVQEAISFVKAAGGGVVYFPPGTYKVDQALTLTSGTGIRIVGSGYSSRITTTHATANIFSLNSCANCSIENLRLSATTTTGAAIGLVSCTEQYITNVFATGGYGYSIDDSGTSNFYCIGSTLTGSARALRANRAGSAGPTLIMNCQVNATTNIEFNGVTSLIDIIDTYFITGTTGILFNASLTGTAFRVRDCVGLDGVTTPFDLSGLATDPDLRQSGNNVDGYVVSQASGGGGGSSFTPDRSKGREAHIRLTSGGAAVLTIPAPTPTPKTTMRDTRLTLKITAAAGGNITARFNAVYLIVGGGTDIVVADTNTEVVEFLWDVQVSKWRECFRAVSAT